MNEAEKMEAITRMLRETDLGDTEALDAATDFASSFEEEGDRAWALGEIAKALAELGKWDEAEELASKITLADEQADTLVAIARKLMGLDDSERALKNLTIAEKTAKTGRTNWVWQTILSGRYFYNSALNCSGVLGCMQFSVWAVSYGRPLCSSFRLVENCRGCTRLAQCRARMATV